MPDSKGFTLSIVVPAYNEGEVLPEFHRRLSAVMDTLNCAWEVLYVNDGSTDNTIDVMHQLRAPHVAIIDLSRNFGKEIALTAGLDHARGDAAVVIDADLQDPPEVIPELIQKWQEGYDVVYARRTTRDGETFFKKLSAKSFYRVIQRVSRVKIPADTGDFRLLSRRAVDALTQLREQHRFMKGLFSWIGYPQTAVYYQRKPRFAGQSKWDYWLLWNLALEGITSFSIAPLKIATYAGLLTSLGSFSYASFIIYKTLVYGDPVKGYPSLMVVILFLGGVQLMSIGVIGEYLGRMFNETKRRPLYFVQNHIPSSVKERPDSIITTTGQQNERTTR
ncbi:MAG: glycosyltransferase family 2 protein [Desulfuromonadales bacterium]|nr:glycosyltransferase family 2 protein [Desulfuromonadales bacterium]